MSSVFSSDFSMPVSPSLESMASSRPPSPFSDSVLIDNPIQHGEEPVDAEMIGPSKNRHIQFYFKDGNVVFLVEKTLYKVHRYFFQRDSAHFRAEFKGASGSSVLGVSDEYPFILSNIKSNDFEEFLSILYPTDFRHPNDRTTAQWTSILYLAALWGFETVKLLSIHRLSFTASPIDKIVLGRRYNISEWLGGAYEAVCTRSDPLTVEEGIRLGVEDAVRIAAVRQAYGYTAVRYEPGLLPTDLPRIFGLGDDAEDTKWVEDEEAMMMKKPEDHVNMDSAIEQTPTAENPVSILVHYPPDIQNLIDQAFANLDFSGIKRKRREARERIAQAGDEQLFAGSMAAESILESEEQRLKREMNEMTERQKAAREQHLKDLVAKWEKQCREQEKRISFFG